MHLMTVIIRSYHPFGWRGAVAGMTPTPFHATPGPGWLADPSRDRLAIPITPHGQSGTPEGSRGRKLPPCGSFT
jgi:hypothetical protein